MKLISRNRFLSFGIALVGLVTAYALWCAWINWSGAKEWQRTLALLEANDIARPEQSMPPVDQNFARTPLIASLTDFDYPAPENVEEFINGAADFAYEDPETHDRFLAMTLPGHIRGVFPDWKSGQKTDFSEIENILGDRNITEWMAQFRSELAELDAAAQRPHSRLASDWGNDFWSAFTDPIPFLSEIFENQKFQTVRATAALSVGDNEEALSALKVSLKLARASQSHPSLVGTVSSFNLVDLSLSVVWEGMANNSWRKDDLIKIQEELRELQVLESLEDALVLEMVIFQIEAGAQVKELLIKEVDAFEDMILDDRSLASVSLLSRGAPRGFWDRSRASLARQSLEGAIQPLRERRLPPEEIELQQPNGLTRIFAEALRTFPSSSLILRGYESSNSIDLARLACALELYKIETGRYPERLEDLTPQFIKTVPLDLFSSNQFLRYTQDPENGHYRIYSIGRNGRDDGGKVELRYQRPVIKRKADEGDLVWKY